MKIGEWVRSYRKEHGLSMQAFGDMCGLSRAYISILEKGVNPTTNKPFSPTMQTVQKIAEVTGLDLNSLDKDQTIIGKLGLFSFIFSFIFLSSLILPPFIRV